MTADPAPCGTPAAARRHYRRGEPLDEDCRQANRRRAADANPNSTGRTLAIDRRGVRNGLPEFVPYVYRGLGCDINGEGGDSG